MPEVHKHLRNILDNITSYFTGEFDRVLISSSGKSDVVDIAQVQSTKPELPPKGVTELDRLAHVVSSVEDDC